MTSSGPGCPATAFEGATRRANALVARRVACDWEATPDLSRALRREKSKWWSFLRKCDRTGSIFGGIDSHAWRSEATHKHVLAFYPTFSIRERYIVSVSSNFLTQISCGIKTKCRKTRAMLRDFTILNSLALKQLRHFYDSRHSFAKIAIPYTILSLAQFTTQKTSP